MNNKSNKLTNSLAQWFIRRVGVKRLGLGLAAVALLAGALCVTGFGQRYYRLGGAWVGGNPAYTWNCLFAPSDPLGQTAAARPILSYFQGPFAALLAQFGADTISDATGEIKMISPDTAQWTLIGWMQASPHQPGDLLQSKGILISHGTWKFTSDNTAVLNYTLDVYPPNADADGDGFPDAGAQPVLSIPTVDNAKRVPIL